MEGRVRFTTSDRDLRVYAFLNEKAGIDGGKLMGAD